MRTVKFLLPMLLGLTMIAVGCSKPPQAEIQAAKAAVDAARSAGAADYAQASLKEAEDASAALDAELQAQEKKFALFRSYKQVATLAADVKSKGEKAAADAAAGKEQAKNEATQLINEAKGMRDEANGLLANAPAGKGSKADIDAMKSDLQGVETSISAADQAFNEGRYIEAKNKAMAAKSAAETVKTAVQNAIEMRKSKQKKS